jgi:two-component system response regulator NreC
VSDLRVLDPPRTVGRLPVTVVIADDHAVVRDGVRATLARQEGWFDVVAEAADVPATMAAVRAYEPALLILDLTMPGGSPLALLPTLRTEYPRTAVLVFTMHDDPGYAREAVGAGARALVLKEAEPSELLHAIRTVLAGGLYLHPRVGAALAAHGGPTAAAPLSEREREVVRLIALGHTNAEIAEIMHLAERTVKTYRARAVEKLRATSRADLTAYAHRHGLLG